MEFIATANRGGYRPTGREINEWRLRPDPNPASKGKLLEPEVPAVPERRVQMRPTVFGSAIDNALKAQGLWINPYLKRLAEDAQKNLAYLNSSWLFRDAIGASLIAGFPGEYEVIPGKPARPARYAPDKPAERFLAHLRRLGWVERDARGHYGVTLLGNALLRAEASVDSADEDSPVMVLAAEDELAYGRVIGVIAECGDAFIMDAYLGTQALVHILEHTNASRLLVGSNMGPRRLTELAVQISLTPPNPGGAVRELRRAVFHDRWLIGEHTVYGLGTSLNSVGRSMTTLVEMPDSAAREIRANAESLWDGADVIAQSAQDEEEDDDHDADVKPPDHASGNGVRPQGGVFLHEGCSIRHRSEQVARRCTKGSVGG